MSRTIIRDCRVWDGSGKAAFPADLLIEGGRIRAVARNRGQLGCHERNRADAIA
jgi:N-acyl-D-aspartate/D-glutamate deacylase